MISIVTPTYNRADLVQNTIKSIQAQTFTNWQLIIVDDGSTDDTEKALRPYLSDKRIHYVWKPNSGQAKSLNFGVQHATGEFIVFLDSDDEAYSNWLEVVNRYLTIDTAFACSGAIRKLMDGTIIQEGLGEYDLYGKKYMLKFTCGSLFIRRTIFNEIGGYDAEMRSNIQTDLGYRLVTYLQQNKMNVQSIYQNLIQINIHAGERIRTNWEKRKDGAIQFLNKHYQFIYNNNKKEIANLCATIAYSYYKLNNRKASVGYLLKAIKHNPFRIVNYARTVKYALL